MIDHFAQLNQLRGPWLDGEELKQTYHELSRSASSDDPGRLPALNEAYRLLADPKSRLRHFLELEGIASASSGSIDPAMANLFMQAAELTQRVDSFLVRLNAATNALTKSFLNADLQEEQQRTKGLLRELTTGYNNVIEELRLMSEQETRDPSSSNVELVEIYQRLSYLSRWIEQLKEKQFQLSIA